MNDNQIIKNKYCLLGCEYNYEIKKEFDHNHSIRIELPSEIIMTTVKTYPSQIKQKRYAKGNYYGKFYWAMPISLSILRNGVQIEIFNEDMLFQGECFSEFNLLKPYIKRESDCGKTFLSIYFYNKKIKVSER